MTKEQKAQQAQTIERWSHSGYEEMTPYDDGVYVLYDDHKAIVDSQSQKIAELTAENNGRALLLGAAGAEIERLSKEERAVLDSVRGANKLRIELSNCGPATEDCDKLIAIFDNLSKRGVKKYSEDELRAAFEAQPVETVFPETYNWQGGSSCVAGMSANMKYHC